MRSLKSQYDRLTALSTLLFTANLILSPLPLGSILIILFNKHRLDHLTLIVALALGPTFGIRCMRMGEFLNAMALSIKLRMIVEEARADKRPPLLLLRSFSNNQLTHAAETVFGIRLPTFMARAERGFLYFLGLATASLGRSVAIGNPSECLVFGQQMWGLEHFYVESDDKRWVDLFMIMARAARVILLIPETSPGIEREMHTLVKRKLTGKALVFMPPLAPKGMSNRKVARRWEDVRAFWEGKGMALPAYNPLGLVYRPNKDFSIAESRTLGPEDLTEGLKARVGELLPGSTMEATPLRDVMRQIERRGFRFLFRQQSDQPWSYQVIRTVYVFLFATMLLWAAHHYKP